MDAAAVAKSVEPYRQLTRAPNGCIVHTCLFDPGEKLARHHVAFCRAHWNAIEPWRRRRLRELHQREFKRWYDCIAWTVQMLVLRDQPLWLAMDGYDLLPSCGTPEGNPF